MAASKIAKIAENAVTKSISVSTKIGMKGLELGKRSRPHLSTFWSTAKVELAPPMPSQFPLIQKSFVNVKNSLVKGKFLNLTMKEAASNTLVGVEIFFWFIVGEMIGRRSIIGYKV
ncbi:ATP synthase subunit g, mitochondrial-like [Xenia sp. Carnegie-2017]|uniref:ATP synthase subunit g, mitochondrial-like n=1 Tax=Xenia sp. Carnegie-2017 TaxID=2897299 RepID=UPI001F04FCD2|nr:ATP synthase subunit g, mitochondrial-like [Xenia sp. Carnegie-2017]